MEALQLPIPTQWVEPVWVGVQILLILLAGYLAQRFVAKGLTRLGERYPFPPQLLMPLRGGLRWFIMGSAVIVVLERLGVSATVLWTALSGFVAVAAIAFFAMWSVLSNLLCAVLIFTVGPFRVGDHIELLDTAEKPGALGRVVDINLLYTTLEDATAPEPGSLLQIPNALIFQRVLRRWPAGVPVPQGKLHPVPPSGGAATTESAAAPKGASFP